MYTASGGLWFVLLFSAVHMLNLLQKDANSFGAYNVTWTRYEVCKGPKSKNATLLSTKLSEEGNDYFGHFNITFLVETKFEEFKIVVYSLKTDSKNLLWTYKISDPCHHFAFGNLIETYFGSKNCIIKKGPYYFSINFNEMNKVFLGASFFYGEFMLKTVITSKQGNIICLVVVMKITKKTEVEII